MEESFLPSPTTPCLPGRIDFVFVCFIISGGVRNTRKVKPVLLAKRTARHVREGPVINCDNSVIPVLITPLPGFPHPQFWTLLLAAMNEDLSLSPSSSSAIFPNAADSPCLYSLHSHKSRRPSAQSYLYSPHISSLTPALGVCLLHGCLWYRFVSWVLMIPQRTQNFLLVCVQLNILLGHTRTLSSSLILFLREI